MTAGAEWSGRSEGGVRDLEHHAEDVSIGEGVVTGELEAIAQAIRVEEEGITAQARAESVSVRGDDPDLAADCRSADPTSPCDQTPSSSSWGESRRSVLVVAA